MKFLDKLFGGKKTAGKIDISGVKFLNEDDGSKISHTMPIAVTPPPQHYIIKTEGKYLIYDSLREMPQELRAQIESLENTDEVKNIYTVVFEGKRTVYTHFNDIPLDVREAITNFSEKKKRG
ncbi:MAG: hypothetical protein WCS96_00495 [Victivallales bacterium]|jgi:hypothetical protein